MKESKDDVVALVDADEKRLAEAKRYLQRNDLDPAKVQTFTDYRVMFDKIGNQHRCGFHRHAQSSSCRAGAAGDATGQGGLLREAALPRHRPGPRTRAEWPPPPRPPRRWATRAIARAATAACANSSGAAPWATSPETFSWTDRANGATGPRPPTLPVPAGLHWDEWIGPAPSRPYHAGLHPHDWHGWYDFGNGSLGNMGCHVLDGVFWALRSSIR